MIERSRAECRFFQRLTHRFGADRIDQTQDDHFVSQQLQGPVTSPTGRAYRPTGPTSVPRFR